METHVFKRTEATGELISGSRFNLTIGLTLLWGFAVNAMMVKYIDPERLVAINFLLFLLVYFGCCLFGVYLYNKSDRPLISFIGYNFVVVPFGFIINMMVHQYDPDLVLDAIRVTAFVTIIMMLLGTLFPAFFQKIAVLLFMALVLVIVAELVEIFIFRMHHGIIDWIVVLIFCGYIGLDWGRANRIPKTTDNAIDSAAALYMDIINLFLRILRIMGRRR
ncbi:US12 family protein [bacterium]|nr:US12 family protein [bacterium]